MYMPATRLWEQVEDKMLLPISGQQIKFHNFGQLKCLYRKPYNSMPKDMDNHYVSNFTTVHVFRIPPKCGKCKEL